jgi:hypothetical protein
MQGTSISEIRKRNEQISKLTNNINNSIDSDNEMIIDENISVGDTEISEVHNRVMRRPNIQPVNYYDDEEEYFEGDYDVPKIVKEGLVLVFIYLLLSTDFAMDMADRYLPLFTIDDDSNISIISKLVYGILLAVLFFIARHFAL